MQPIILISVIVILLIVVGLLVLAAISMRKLSLNSDSGEQEKYPRGTWTASGLSIGVGFGVALGLVLDNLALGIAMGAGIGTAIGTALEQRNQDNLLSLPETGRKSQIWALGVGLLLLVLFAGLAVFLLLRNG